MQSNYYCKQMGILFSSKEECERQCPYYFDGIDIGNKEKILINEKIVEKRILVCKDRLILGGFIDVE